MNTYRNMNLTYYSGEDLYSDGDIEQELYRIVSSGEEIWSVLRNDRRWPLLYHLSPQRRNLLEWFPFDPNANLLEVGGGCGALTGMFCEKVKSVTSIELSKRRAEIMAERTKDAGNLEIIVGNFNDVQATEKYDYVTLIGVLEYAGSFTDGSNPYAEFLRQVSGYLKPEGTLIVAIENRFGLKYWAGAQEDHTGGLFDGLVDYVGNQAVRTFTKQELTELLQTAGLGDLQYYYPHPDYKLPDQIFSDKYLPSVGQVQSSPGYEADRLMLWNEKIVFNSLITNGLYNQFANSFLVFARSREESS